jgi:hypothetical protein
MEGVDGAVETGVPGILFLPTVSSTYSLMPNTFKMRHFGDSSRRPGEGG